MELLVQCLKTFGRPPIHGGLSRADVLRLIQLVDVEEEWWRMGTWYWMDGGFWDRPPSYDDDVVEHWMFRWLCLAGRKFGDLHTLLGYTALLLPLLGVNSNGAWYRWNDLSEGVVQAVDDWLSWLSDAGTLEYLLQNEYRRDLFCRTLSAICDPFFTELSELGTLHVMVALRDWHTQAELNENPQQDQIFKRIFAEYEDQNPVVIMDDLFGGTEDATRLLNKQGALNWRPDPRLWQKRPLYTPARKSLQAERVDGEPLVATSSPVNGESVEAFGSAGQDVGKPAGEKEEETEVNLMLVEEEKERLDSKRKAVNRDEGSMMEEGRMVPAGASTGTAVQATVEEHELGIMVREGDGQMRGSSGMASSSKSTLTN
ncbi:hypothetical protein CALVIDRAFT_540371 [Calocera viscosa TUFC12733]|uniref:Uncharacterized protein n=1 Tax=Calocera viscosa (strain TUFC12733) TaxID=1330018 RepID=A0A167J084_CALVF|nr:hypothetical protein CALVIDRAFT_540371 [Calocera viscosa TUFC12733]